MDPKSNNKKSKIVGLLILFLLLILVATYVVYSYYIKNNEKEALKNEFFSKIGNHDLAFFMENERYAKIAQKLENQNYEANSNIQLSTTMENNMFSKLDLSKFEFSHAVTRSNQDNKTYSKLDAKYAGNHLLTLDFILNEEQLAVKSDEIVNKYVGIRKENTQNIVNQIWQKEVDLSTEKKLKNFLLEREPMDLSKIAKSSSLATYAKLFQESVSAESFSKKENVVVTLDSEQVSTTEYTVELDSTQTNQLIRGISENLEKDDALLSELVVSQVQTFENDNAGILEYTDNENVSEIQGEENNFTTAINSWDGNTIAENTITNEVVPVNNTVENTTVENTVSNNMVTPENTVTNETPETVIHEQTTQEDSQPATPPAPEPTPEVPEQPANTAPENVIEEADNVRRQGFIAVNEEEEASEEEEETFVVGQNFEETTKNMEKLVKKIDWSSYLLSGAKANCSQQELLEIVQNILQEKIKQNNHLTIKMYVTDEKVVKLNFELSETPESLDFEFVSKADNEKYLYMTALKGKEETASGYRVSLYKKNEDAMVKTKININKVHKNKIHQKTTIDLETKGTSNSKKYTTTVDVAYSDNDGEFKIALDNALNFDLNPEIEDLNDENCLFLDNLSNEEMLLNVDAIKQKTKDVLREKNRNLNMIEINDSNSVVQQTEQPTNSSEDETAKGEARQVLIQTISAKMREYLDRGENLKIEDLEGLEIPNYEVNISINSNLAIITINGYRFNLDSDFNLSDS